VGSEVDKWLGAAVGMVDGSLGIAVAWATISCLISFLRMTRGLPDAASETEIGIWSVNRSGFLTNAAFVYAASVALISEKRAFLADL
jgi:hypothetical protein